MKPLHVLLASAAIVAVSILVYDRFIRPADRPSGNGALLDDGDAGTAGSSRGDPRRRLTARMADQERRVGNLETALAALRADVARVVKLAERLRETGAERPFRSADDEGELAVLRLQMEELERRREARRQSMMVKRKLEQIGATFSETEHAAVMERMVRFQVAVTELWKRVREEAIADQELVASDYTVLTDEAAKDLRALLPVEKAAAVIKGFLTVGPPGHRPPR